MSDTTPRTPQTETETGTGTGTDPSYEQTRRLSWEESQPDPTSDPTSDTTSGGEPGPQDVAPPGRQAPRTHPLSAGHLAIGLVFLGLAAAWALHEADVIEAEGSWVVPLILMLAGGAGLLATVLGGRRRA